MTAYLRLYVKCLGATSQKFKFLLSYIIFYRVLVLVRKKINKKLLSTHVPKNNDMTKKTSHGNAFKI